MVMSVLLCDAMSSIEMQNAEASPSEIADICVHGEPSSSAPTSHLDDMAVHPDVRGRATLRDEAVFSMDQAGLFFKGCHILGSSLDGVSNDTLAGSAEGETDMFGSHRAIVVSCGMMRTDRVMIA